MRNAVTHMDKELKQLLNNPKVLYSVAAILFIFLICATVDIFNGLTYEEEINFDNVKIDTRCYNDSTYYIEQCNNYSGVVVNE